MANKKKVLTSGVAVATAAALLFGGTFAWQSISQTALNEVSASVNPGGRLHDDFNNISGTVDAKKVTIGDKELTTMTFDKNVYVENFTDYAENGVQVFARVRLDEYMELGANAGKLDAEGKKAASNTAVSVMENAKLDDKTTWTTHKLGDEEDTENPFHQYWNWELGGEAVTYMPTFNKNKDSLEADINGSSSDDFATYVDYSAEGKGEKTGIAIYDTDAAEDDKEVDELGDALKASYKTLDEIINAETEDRAKETLNAIDNTLLTDHVRVEQETHTAAKTLSFTNADAPIISMATYKEWVANGWDGIGNYWVYDEDGWAYWAAPIDPETATAPLLNGISRTATAINQDWYYAINVVAQFVTYDDLGQDDGTGFYDLAQGNEPSADALDLLSNIGVQVGSDVKDHAGLETALTEGGVVTLKDNIAIDSVLTVNKDTVLNLNGYTLSVDDEADGLWNETDKNWSLISVQNGVTLTINGDEGSFVQARENDSFAVDVRDGSKVVINGGNFVGNVSAVYVKEGEAVINGGHFSIQQTGAAGVEYKYVLNCLDANYANGTAKITVTGGSFENFDPSGELENTDPRNYLAAGYESNKDGDVYTVTKTVVADSGADAVEGETA